MYAYGRTLCADMLTTVRYMHVCPYIHIYASDLAYLGLPPGRTACQSTLHRFVNFNIPVGSLNIIKTVLTESNNI